MKKNFMLLAFALVASVALFTSCDKNNDESGNGDESKDIVVKDGDSLPAKVNGVVTVAEGASVKLDGGCVVFDGGKLVINKSVTITAQYDEENTDFIFVEQGGKIEADGENAEGVIVMTSTKKELGAWGGIHICGKAPINTSIPSKSEIEGKPYGGTDANDNSGTLRYVRLEYTGYSYSDDQECNGVSFYGVGAGTTVEYVQAYRGSDDGFEFFGGTVNIKNCVATSCSDDSFDWTDGWRGKAQFLVAYHEDGLSYKCDCLMECDNNGNDNDVDPSSHPVIANATLVGRDYSEKTDGVMLKAGTEVELYNSIITGKNDCIVVKTAVADAALASGKSTLANIFMSSELLNKEAAPTYTNADFVAAGNTTDYVSALSSHYVGSVAAEALPTSDKFFTATDYAGAIKDASSDWTKGWTRCE